MLLLKNHTSSRVTFSFITKHGVTFHRKLFLWRGVVSLLPNPKLEDHPLSALTAYSI